MLKKRIIPCLDIKNGRTVKGINFEGLVDAGDPVDLAAKYVQLGADELVFLDISATVEARKTIVSLVEKIAQKINIPFTVGGGISSPEDVRRLLDSGADKISINSSAVKNKKLISSLANEFGSQCVVVAIDAKLDNGIWKVFINGGTIQTDLQVIEWAKIVEQEGAGEILLTSMDSDGTNNGFQLEITKMVSDVVNLPVIASGGAGNMMHFKELFQKTSASAALAASVFHFGKIMIPELKQYLKKENILVR